MTRAHLVLLLLVACGGGKTADSGATTPSGATSPGTPTATGTATGTAATGTPTGTPGTGTTTGTTTTTTTGAQQCAAAAANPGALDPMQTPYDDMVFFCHRDQGGNWHLLNVAVQDCLPHINHNNDLFPTTICDS